MPLFKLSKLESRGEGWMSKLRGYNEMLHRIFGYLAQSMADEQDDAWLFEVLVGMSEHYQTVEPIKWALEEAGKRVGRHCSND